MLKVKSALEAYGSSGLEYQVDTASPHQLICMLYDGAAKAILTAKAAMANRMIAEKGRNISKAIAIIEEGLRVCLDRSAGGELADNLDSLYDYLSRRLLEANLRNDALALDEVYGLLVQLKTAWEQVKDQPPTPAAGDARQQEAARNPLSYGRV